MIFTRLNIELLELVALDARVLADGEDLFDHQFYSFFKNVCFIHTKSSSFSTKSVILQWKFVIFVRILPSLQSRGPECSAQSQDTPGALQQCGVCS